MNKKRNMRNILATLVFCAVWSIAGKKGLVVKKENISFDEIVLPKTIDDSKTSLEKILRNRRSVRNYKNKALTLQQLAQLLWAAQGITNKQGLRTAPSAGALYPIEIYVVVGNVENIAAGIYRYNCKKHTIIPIKPGDKRSELASASLGQSCVGEGAIDIVITGIFERTSRKYGARAQRYVYMEAGHVAQNIYLQAAALGLDTVSVGAFDDENVKKVICAQANEQPLYVMPIGQK
ncbi:SagB/ThcOx family dehydrogenase [Candidatus Dependentiae bacterium]